MVRLNSVTEAQRVPKSRESSTWVVGNERGDEELAVGRMSALAPGTAPIPKVARVQQQERMDATPAPTGKHTEPLCGCRQPESLGR
jgi:hypothetical protein